MFAYVFVCLLCLICLFVCACGCVCEFVNMCVCCDVAVLLNGLLTFVDGLLCCCVG